MFRSVLVANRGEIARRIIRTCRRLGVETVAVHSDADTDEPHVREADRAVRLGPPPAAESYLAIDRIVDAALRSGAEAVHPGYGFLAENGDFAEACADKDLVFIGPEPDTIRLMADKAAAKRHLEDAGVPVIPGADRGDLAAAAQRIGFPVLVKAVAGGGGKGMRRVDRVEDLDEAIAGAAREAQAAFGDDRVLVEKLVDRPRHVEIQVFGDRHGDVIHLLERECSIQRRHQKIVEESPSPAVDDDLRRRMGDAAVRAAASVGYLGAGTVEMLLSDVTREFFFLEMNTRLQVEHPVTEMITGFDLVEWQLRIAAGEPLPLTQEEVRGEGHAIEVRIYAEDPARDFLPQTGRILVLGVPERPGVRLDAGVESGSVVSRHYDPMIGKLIVHGRDREDAISTMVDALRETAVLGVTTNTNHLLDVVTHPAFAAGELVTTFLDEHLPGWQPAPPDGDTLLAAAAALLPPAGPDPWDALGAWRVAGVGGWTVRLRDQLGDEHEVEVHRRPPSPDGSVAVDGHVVWVHAGGRTSRLEYLPATRHAASALLEAGDALSSQMPGTVAAVEVSVGDEVTAGTTLIVVEAMKMETPVKAPADGRVSAVHVAVGDTVEADEPLVEIEPLADGEGDDGAPA